jgi:hypothetical protein
MTRAYASPREIQKPHPWRSQGAGVFTYEERVRTDVARKNARKVERPFARAAVEEHSLKFMVKNRRLRKPPWTWPSASKSWHSRVQWATVATLKHPTDAQKVVTAKPAFVVLQRPRRSKTAGMHVLNADWKVHAIRSQPSLFSTPLKT